MRNLVLAGLVAVAPAQAGIISQLNVLAIDGGAPVVIETAPGIFEAPNWGPDGASFLFNQDGRFYRVPVTGGAREAFDVGGLSGCWGEHAFSPDGRWFALSCPAPGVQGPDVHIVPAAGGAARRLTQQPVSFFHGWSPDGTHIVFTSILGDHEDIYTVPFAGGVPQRLTHEALNDGGEYSADGRFIYFNSNRSGSMQIWRMRTDGAEAAQITDDDFDNWYPHPSPDGQWLAVLSYRKGEATNGHPMNKDVVLRLFALGGGPVRVLARFTGGQGTFDSPCWSPDAKKIAFVSYQVAPSDQRRQP